MKRHRDSMLELDKFRPRMAKASRKHHRLPNQEVVPTQDDTSCDSCQARLSEPLSECDLCDRLRCSSDSVGDATRPSDRIASEDRFLKSTRMRRHQLAASVVRWDGSPLRRLWRRNSGALLWTLTLIMLALTTVARADELETALRSTTMSPSLPPTNTTRRTTTGLKVCQSMDLRNTLTELGRLRNCRVVEGFLRIVLMPESTKEKDFANYTFPNLVEITDYFIVYRVPGLRSLGQLFPNLSVIRGNALFVNYGFAVFQNIDMQEIGLHSLTNIVRGTVRFGENPKLCYTDTINWNLITQKGSVHEFVTNKKKNECPICEKDCPERLSNSGERLCWNKQKCQKVCNCGEDIACSDTGECCHKSCLGGCTGKTANDCTVCREFVVNNTQCVDKCPPNTYEFMNRRCITKAQCRLMPKPKGSKRDQNPYKPFGNKCLLDCPADYMEVNTTGVLSCKRCDGQCLRECPGDIINSVEAAQRLRGCTFIKGNLEISIQDGENVVRELEVSLRDIVVIDGYLKIFRSLPLVSLNFFKNLTEIRGNKLTLSDYSLVVIDNLNLQELWNWTNRAKPLSIKSVKGEAKIMFHYNPKLCTEEIELLRIKTKLGEFSENDVSKVTNGDKVACNLTELQTEVYQVSTRIAMIHWKKFVHHDERKIIGYVLYYKEAPFQNVTLYESRDANGGDGWVAIDVPLSKDEDKPYKSKTYYTYTLNANEKRQNEFKESVILNSLKPYTQYVYYVKTYAISMENLGAISKLVYFKTAPGTPSAPRHLSIYPNSTDTLVMSWMEPAEPNGLILYYKVTGKYEKYEESDLSERNYCDEPMLPMVHKSIMEMAAEKKKQAELEMNVAKKKDETKAEDEMCVTRKKHVETVDETDINKGIAFEDALHNTVYVKRDNKRRKREVGNSTITYSNYTWIDPMSSDKDEVEGNVFTYFERTLPATNLSFVMHNLKHFGKYNIQVIACRDPTTKSTEDPCSNEAMKSEQTFRKERADDIPKGTFRLTKSTSNDSLTTIKFEWEEPVDPNGIILTYHLEYKRVDLSNLKPSIACITGVDFRNNDNTMILDKLPPGNYSVRVRATTFAGDGAYSEALHFDVPESNLEMGFWQIMMILFSCFCFVLLCIFAMYVLKKKYMENEAQNMRLIATVNPEYVSPNVYKPDSWELPRKKIQLLKELGNGSFGMVYEGIARDVIKGRAEVRCAVKTVNENATLKERDDFLNEASVMKAFNTHHVVRLLGVVSIGQPTLVIMELMTNGDLKTYLRSHRPDTCEDINQNPPTLKRILQMAIEIADGMAYLAAKKFVHRDLAARNCMVADDLTVKIGDFGMTRDIYETDYYRKGTKGLMPVRWMAPESLRDGLFASSSDVWSYGVVLWEMVTLASQPYQGLSNDQALRYIIDGGVMERPENCPDSLYELMRQTWNHKEDRRPSFIDIIAFLLMQEIDIESFEKVSFYHSPEGIEARNQNLQFHPNDKELELEALHEEEEPEGQEDSPLRQDFGDNFSSFEPTIGIKNGTTAHYNKETFKSTPNKTLGFLDLDSSKVPLKAGFDDFDGVSTGSLASSKDTLNLPFAEDSVKSVKNSPFAQKKSNSKGNISQGSLGRQSLSPQSPMIIPSSGNSGSRGSPSVTSTGGRLDPEYENRSPISISSQPHDSVSFRVSFPSLDAIDSESTVIIMSKDSSSPSPRTPIHAESNNTSVLNKQQYSNKSPGDSQQPPTLNNGYIGGAAAT